MFDRKPKSNTNRELYAGKFISKEALAKGLAHLGRYLGLKPEETEPLIERYGLEEAYVHLQSGGGKFFRG